jgi:hypothetical protein
MGGLLTAHDCRRSGAKFSPVTAACARVYDCRFTITNDLWRNFIENIAAENRNPFSKKEIYMKQGSAITPRNESDANVITAPDKNKTSIDPVQQREDAAALFVTKFTNHYRRCVSLAKQFAVDNPDPKDSAAISQLCRASQEMLEQAKEARAMTEIYLALDDKHRDAVRPIIIARFKDISKSAHASWLRFCDSIQFARTARHEIKSAQVEFEPHAREFRETLRRFIALSDKTT